MARNKGFTLLETMIVMVIIGILLNVAAPNFVRARRRAHAARIVRDYLTIRNAVFVYYSETGTFPKDQQPGKVPPEIEQYLPKDFTFDLRPKHDVQYDWENWVTKKGKPKHKKTGVLYGISVTTKDKEIVTAIQHVYKGPFFYTIGKRYTFVISPIED